MTARAKPETPLALRITRAIRESGPISVSRYMALCLGDPEHGYYMTRDPLGLRGDFTTAPEVSQMFGELIGLWAADMWMKLGRPAPLALVELGPGRGTLMADALRAARAMPGFTSALEVHLIEMSPVLRERQRAALAGTCATASWHERLETVAAGPMIAIANEFLDALPVIQFEHAGGRWRERMVDLDASGALVIGHGDPASPSSSRRFPEVPDGTILESSPDREAAAAALARRCAEHPGAALIIDYGHAFGDLGDTLQAVRGHEAIGILDAPGESDLTSHVDFAALVRAARGESAACYGPMAMGQFLTGLGIAERAKRLKAGKDADTQAAVDAALARLTAAAGMGSLFKVLVLASPGTPAPEPFAPEPFAPEPFANESGPA